MCAQESKRDDITRYAYVEYLHRKSLVVMTFTPEPQANESDIPPHP